MNGKYDSITCLLEHQYKKQLTTMTSCLTRVEDERINKVHDHYLW